MSEVDSQHHQLEDKVADLEILLENDSDNLILREAWDKLADLTINHFSYEEQLMAQFDYPAQEQEAHIKEHNDLLSNLNVLLKQWQHLDNHNKHSKIYSNILNLWLHNHILKQDTALVVHLNRKGQY